MADAIATDSQLFQSIVGMTNAEAVPIATGLNYTGTPGAQDTPVTSSGTAPATSTAANAGSPGAVPVANASAVSTSGTRTPQQQLGDAAIAQGTQAALAAAQAQGAVFENPENGATSPTGEPGTWSLPGNTASTPQYASILEGLSPGQTIQTDAFGSEAAFTVTQNSFGTTTTADPGAPNISTSITMNSDGTYNFGGLLDLANVPADVAQGLLAGGLPYSLVNEIHNDYTPVEGQVPFNGNYIPGNGDVRLSNGQAVTQANYPEYELQQEMAAIKHNQGGLFEQIASAIVPGLVAAAGAFVGGPALGAAISGAETLAQTSNTGDAAKSAATSGVQSELASVI